MGLAEVKEPIAYVAIGSLKANKRKYFYIFQSFGYPNPVSFADPMKNHVIIYKTKQTFFFSKNTRYSASPNPIPHKSVYFCYY